MASDERVLVSFSVPSEPGNERLALARVADAVAGSGLTGDQLERLKTAVAEATMNAIEHGNHNRAELAVDVTVAAVDHGVAVSIVDQGGAHAPAPETPVELPDLDLKLAGLQTPRGWGLFLIQNMVDAMDVSIDGDLHTVRLVMHTAPAPRPRDPEGGPRAEQV
ncbi:MAG TPA: ATP-binding protein [Mycobacteriales bacterium]|jgi:anti-sigma regulatory factor (Ser/Thr protein kinase)|nr:ATP-binding protein [Mycobacteriales bacterium]